MSVALFRGRTAIENGRVGLERRLALIDRRQTIRNAVRHPGNLPLIRRGVGKRLSVERAAELLLRLVV
jgi:hypothetical protein